MANVYQTRNRNVVETIEPKINQVTIEYKITDKTGDVEGKIDKIDGRKVNDKIELAKQSGPLLVTVKGSIDLEEYPPLEEYPMLVAFFEPVAIEGNTPSDLPALTLATDQVGVSGTLSVSIDSLTIGSEYNMFVGTIWPDEVKTKSKRKAGSARMIIVDP